MSYRIIRDTCDNCGCCALVTFIAAQHTTLCEDCLREAADALKAQREYDQRRMLEEMQRANSREFIDAMALAHELQPQRPVDPNPPLRPDDGSSFASTTAIPNTGTMTS